jgi:hypothetical protein
MHASRLTRRPKACELEADSLECPQADDEAVVEDGLDGEGEYEEMEEFNVRKAVSNLVAYQVRPIPLT